MPCRDGNLAGVKDSASGMLWTVLLYDCPRLRTHGLQLGVVPETLFQTSHGALGVKWIEHPTVFSGVHKFRPASVVLRAKNGQTTRHGFGNNQTPVIFKSGHYKCVSRGIVQSQTII